MTLLQRLLHFFRSLFVPAPAPELEQKTVSKAQGEPMIQPASTPTKENVTPPVARDVPSAQESAGATKVPLTSRSSVAPTPQPAPKPMFNQNPVSKPTEPVEEKPLRPQLDEAAIAQLSKATFEKMGGQNYVVCPACQAKVNKDAVLRDHRGQKSTQGVVWKCRVCQTDMLIPLS